MHRFGGDSTNRPSSSDNTNRPSGGVNRRQEFTQMPRSYDPSLRTLEPATQNPAFPQGRYGNLGDPPPTQGYGQGFGRGVVGPPTQGYGQRFDPPPTQGYGQGFDRGVVGPSTQGDEAREARETPEERTARALARAREEYMERMVPGYREARVPRTAQDTPEEREEHAARATRVREARAAQEAREQRELDQAAMLGGRRLVPREPAPQRVEQERQEQ